MGRGMGGGRAAEGDEKHRGLWQRGQGGRMKKQGEGDRGSGKKQR